MDISLVPDYYEPAIDDNNNYIDRIPIIYSSGLSCPCGARKDKVYYTKSQFATHCKSKKHLIWLSDLNNNKKNFYVENIKQKELIKSQQIIIERLEIDNNNKQRLIEYLTNQLTEKDLKNK